jgi:hypothetical protein
VHGVADLAGLPGLAQKAVGSVFDTYGAPPRDLRAPGINPTKNQIIGSVEGVTGPLYEPKTQSGRIAKNVGEALPSLALTAGIRKSIEQSIKELQALQAR